MPLEIDSRVATLIQSLAHRLVVVGSVARGKPNPRDIDLLYDIDSSKAEREIREAVRRAAIPFDSEFVGNWCFGYFDGFFTPLEILPIHRGPSYRVVRKRATERDIAGMHLLIAHPDDATA